MNLTALPQQVDEDLAEARHVADERWSGTCAARRAGQVEVLVVAVGATMIAAPPRRTPARSKGWLSSSSLPGLDLGEVEDVVDEGQQDFAAGRGRSAAKSRCSASSAVSSSRPVMPMMPLSGVRISWLMLARNWLLTWLAFSSARLVVSSSSCALCKASVAFLRSVMSFGGQQPADLAPLVVQRQLNGLEPALAPRCVEQVLDHDALVGVHHVELLVPVALGLLGREEVEVRLADDVRRGFAEQPAEKLAAGADHTLPVLEEDDVGRTLQQCRQHAPLLVHPLRRLPKSPASAEEADEQQRDEEGQADGHQPLEEDHRVPITRIDVDSEDSNHSLSGGVTQRREPGQKAAVGVGVGPTAAAWPVAKRSNSSGGGFSYTSPGNA